MKRRFLTIVVVLFAVFALASPSLAQNYYFAVDKEVVEVYWNADGTMSLDYTWVFHNQPSGATIEYVDVGMPNYHFDMSTAGADVNGVAVNVSQGDYEGTGSGFAVVLGGQSIPPGQSGTVHAYIGRITNVLREDSSDQAYASAVFAPAYFGSQYVTGQTDLTVTFHLPPGIQTQEPRWHSAPSGFPSEPQGGLDNEGRIVYTWNNPAASASRQYLFGASFPKSYVPPTAIVTTPPPPSFLDRVAAFFATLVNNLGTTLCFCFFGFMFFGMPVISAVNASRRKMKYLPPKISIEGHGIKRGLTAVEAAILMEQPLDKVMTMVLFGVVKKEAAEVVKRDPLQLAFAKEPPADLHQYEKDFLKAFGESDLTKRRRLLEDMTVALVRSVSDKMKGFSRKETVDYYKSIMERAWQQVEAADTPEVKSQKMDDNLEWTMLDKDYDNRTRRVFTGPVFVPVWWGRYDPAYRPVTTGSARPISAPISSGGSRALPGADFAASVVGGVQTFSSKVIGNVQGFTSRVTGVTNPPPKPSASSGGYHGGGGHSCACACACAGCACACAGGGR